MQQQGIVAGIENIAVFDGGWCEWQLDPNNPYETGVPDGYDPETGERIG